jgi:hypothetical protein
VARFSFLLSVCPAAETASTSIIRGYARCAHSARRGKKRKKEREREEKKRVERREQNTSLSSVVVVAQMHNAQSLAVYLPKAWKRPLSIEYCTNEVHLSDMSSSGCCLDDGLFPRLRGIRKGRRNGKEKE